MYPLLDQVRATITQEQLLTSSPAIILALSGGADSVALLRVLLLLGHKPRVAHCNFHLRNKESDEDEAFVRSLCQKYSLELNIKSFDTEAYALSKGVSIEMAARELRYTWFQSLRQSDELIAVAHNSDDRVETFLLNLSMGTGIRGLSGMPYKREDGIIRPLMDCSRQEILSFLAELGQDYREDSSNASLEYKRNFIRHQLIPCFEQMNPQFKAKTLDTISNLRSCESLYLSELKRLQSELISDKGIVIEQVLQLKEAQTFLFETLRPYHFNKEQILDLHKHLGKLRRGACYESPSHRLMISRDHIEILPKEAQDVPTLELNITEDGGIRFSNMYLQWSYHERADYPSLRCPKDEVLFDADRLWEALGETKCLILRSRQMGDKIKPYGMTKGRKKVSRIFIDNGLTHREREEIRILATKDNQLLWLVNLLADSTFAVYESTKRILHFRVIPTHENQD